MQITCNHAHMRPLQYQQCLVYRRTILAHSVNPQLRATILLRDIFKQIQWFFLRLLIGLAIQHDYNYPLSAYLYRSLQLRLSFQAILKTDCGHDTQTTLTLHYTLSTASTIMSPPTQSHITTNIQNGVRLMYITCVYTLYYWHQSQSKLQRRQHI